MDASRTSLAVIFAGNFAPYLKLPKLENYAESIRYSAHVFKNRCTYLPAQSSHNSDTIEQQWQLFTR